MAGLMSETLLVAGMLADLEAERSVFGLTPPVRERLRQRWTARLQEGGTVIRAESIESASIESADVVYGVPMQGRLPEGYMGHAAMAVVRTMAPTGETGITVSVSYGMQAEEALGMVEMARLSIRKQAERLLDESGES